MRFKECRTAWTLDSILAGFCQGRIALGAAQLKCHDTSKSSDAGAFAIYIGKRTMAKIRVRVSYRSLVGNKLTIGKSALKETAGVSETWMLEFRACNKPGIHFARSHVAICMFQNDTRSFIWICVDSQRQLGCLLNNKCDR